MHPTVVTAPQERSANVYVYSSLPHQLLELQRISYLLKTLPELPQVQSKLLPPLRSDQSTNLCEMLGEVGYVQKSLVVFCHACFEQFRDHPLHGPLIR
jgi:hypothetical protein